MQTFFKYDKVELTEAAKAALEHGNVDFLRGLPDDLVVHKVEAVGPRKIIDNGHAQLITLVSISNPSLCILPQSGGYFTKVGTPAPTIW